MKQLAKQVAMDRGKAFDAVRARKRLAAARDAGERGRSNVCLDVAKPGSINDAKLVGRRGLHAYRVMSLRERPAAPAAASAFALSTISRMTSSDDTCPAAICSNFARWPSLTERPSIRTDATAAATTSWGENLTAMRQLRNRVGTLAWPEAGTTADGQ